MVGRGTAHDGTVRGFAQDDRVGGWPVLVLKDDDSLSADGVFGETGQAAVGGFAEVEAGGAELGVGLELVGDVRRRSAGDVMAVQLDGSGAVRATELGVVVDEGLGDGFELPEGLVSTASLEATSFDLALVDFFGFGGHDAPLCVVRLVCAQ